MCSERHDFECFHISPRNLPVKTLYRYSYATYKGDCSVPSVKNEPRPVYIQEINRFLTLAFIGFLGSGPDWLFSVQCFPTSETANMSEAFNSKLVMVKFYKSMDYWWDILKAQNRGSRRKAVLMQHCPNILRT